MPAPGVVDADGLDSLGTNVIVRLKCSRPEDEAPYRWEVRRILDVLLQGNSNVRYSREIKERLPAWKAFWCVVGFDGADAYWESKHKQLTAGAIDFSRVTEEFTLNTECFVA
jgi:hypothetical protein